MAGRTASVGANRALRMLMGEDETPPWIRLVVRNWGFVYLGFIFLFMWLPCKTTPAGSRILLWIMVYAMYLATLEIAGRVARRPYDGTLFRLFRVHFNLAMVALLALMAPPTVSDYVWSFFSMPLLITIGYFGPSVWLLLICSEIGIVMLVLTFAQGWPTFLDLAAMVAKDAILGLLAAVFYFFVHRFPRLLEGSALAEPATTLIQVLDQRELCQLLADAAKAGIPVADAAVVHLLGGEDGRTLVAQASSNIDLTTLGRTPMEIGKGIAGYAIQHHETVNVPDVGQDDRYLQLHPSFTSFRSLLVAPMYVGDKNVGTISVHSAKKGAFSRRNERFLTVLAAQGATAISNAELYDIRKRRRQQISDILEASLKFGLNQPLDALLQTIAEEVCRCSGYKMAVVNLFDETPHEIVVEAMAGIPPAGMRKLDGLRIPHAIVKALLQEEFRISHSYFIRHDRCPQICDLSQYTFIPHLGERKPGEWHQEDMLIVPIQTQEERLVGYISVDDPVDRQLPSLDTVQALEILASVAATAIENARLYEKKQRRAAQLALLNNIGGKIAAVLGVESVMDRTVRLVQGSFGYHHVALFTINRERGELVMKARAGDFAHLYPPDHRLKLGHGMVGWVGRQGETLLANNVDLEQHYINLYPDLIPTRSELSVPILVGKEKEVVGVLDIQSPRLNAFDDDDVLIMEILADQVAVALENARLYKEADRRETRLQSYLSTITSSLAYHTSLKGLYEFIVEAGAKFLSARDCALFLADDKEGSVPELVAVFPSSQVDKSEAVADTNAGRGLVLHLMRCGQPVRLLGKEMLQHRLWDGERWKELRWYFDPEKDHSLLAVPLCTTKGRIFGALVARRAESEEGFSEFDEMLLKALATNAAADFERVRSLEKTREDAILAERRRLEAGLHEAMNILATGVRWEAERAAEAVGCGRLDTARDALERLQAARTRAYTDLDYLLADLRDPILEKEGLLSALKHRAELIGGGRITVIGDSWERLPRETETMLYRAGQEAMSNAAKHSAPDPGEKTQIKVWLERNAGQVALYVQDNGIGFDVDSTLAQSDKWGLRRLRDIVREAGGRLEVKSEPGKGTTVCATISLPEVERHE